MIQLFPALVQRGIGSGLQYLGERYGIDCAGRTPDNGIGRLPLNGEDGVHHTALHGGIEAAAGERDGPDGEGVLADQGRWRSAHRFASSEAARYVEGTSAENVREDSGMR